MKARQQWMAMLAKLVAPMDAAHAAKALADMLPMLQDFPDGAFTLDSLEHVASNSRGVPDYGALRKALAEWWGRHKPATDPQRERTYREIRYGKGARDAQQDDAEFYGQMTGTELRERIARIQALTDRGLDGTIAGVMRRTTVVGLTKHNPQMLGLLPPEWLPREPAEVVPLPTRDPEPDPTRPKPAHLSPEQLAKARANA